MSDANSMHPRLASLYEQARERFEARFGRRPSFAAAAPGRVNLIGEHTDYNDGFVCPAAIERWVIVVADHAQAGASSTIRSEDFDEELSIDLAGDIDRSEIMWANYLVGVVAMYRGHGIHSPNLDLLFTSTVPIGSGLSSSAAVEVATATMLEQANGVDIDPVEKAHLCQRAEHEYPGTPCGIMDQMISTLGRTGHALQLDCRTNEAQHIPLPPPGEAALLIADTNVRHQLSSGEYAARRRECEAAVASIRENLGRPDLRALRDVSEDELLTQADRLDATLLRRARHVVTENARVVRFASALRAGDLAAAGNLMFESHESLRDDYEVSCPQLDALVEFAGESSERVTGRDRGVYGARMTGGGFGGCVVAIVRPDAIDSVTKRMTDGYRARFEISPTVFTTTTVGGAVALPI